MKTEKLFIRVSPEFKSWLESQAQKEHRAGISDYTRHILRQERERIEAKEKE